ncbi:fungal-specific transcription factor domain-containing protein [Cristinia sonorae]|uniref:Fungal-specific transcription factor domain-containing protein n=1 Tax=Cristinia sonorae TaxID=1940300 RepID=A0A8K0XMF3_9AGAR|nr:fungal-specific transcription factor domain-containing protein [Cristinia sonorae]
MSSSSSQAARDKAKRRNAPLSCAECRRLKLRCSRVFPCASCVKKGCAAICPDGSLTTGKGNRFVLANTEVLHDKISLLASRVRELEDALQEAHADRSKDPHPLLTPELLQIKRPLERESTDSPKEVEVDPTEAIDVGSLSISESGHTSFYGTTANAWYLLKNQEAGEDDTVDAQDPLPTDLPWLNHAFPFSVSSPEVILNFRASLITFLPEIQTTRRMAAIYYRHAAWMYTPVPESEFYLEILPRIYSQSLNVEQDPIDSHRLAVVFMVLALGTLVDLDRPPLSTEASQYYQLGRTALSLDSILECQSIPAIQALLLMCHYMFWGFIDGPRWALMGLAVKLAQSVGLHRDSGRWNLSTEETFKRRSLMWELFTYDSWQSLTFGRPPSFAMAYIDCQMAHDTTETEQGDVEMSFSAWKHRFSSRCLSVVQEQGFGARPSSYKAIQDLDKKVRNFYVPPSLRVPGFGGAKVDMGAPPPSVELTMQRYTAFAIREISIFYLHRGFFAKAIEDHPEDPLGSKYAPSFLAAYNSACSFAGLIKSLHSQHPALTERSWFLFTHVFSCAIVLGSIPTRCPTMALARSALSHLDSTCGLFEDASQNATRAAKILPVLRKLKARALFAMSDPQLPRISPINRLSPEDSGKEDEEFAALGGGTRLVSRKSPSVPSSPQGTSAPEPPSMHQVAMVPSSMHETSSHAVSGHAQSPHSQSPPTSWQSYPQQHHHQASPDYYDYGSYNMVPEQWQANVGYGHIEPSSAPMETMPMHYNMYGQGAQMEGNGYGALHSPVEPHVHPRAASVTASDPDASWRNLFAQFNQA